MPVLYSYIYHAFIKLITCFLNGGLLYSLNFLNEKNKFRCFFFVAGEVERLLREYRQNQELVRNIGAHYYQIIYPVQLRHHEKMGISTREVGAPKVRENSFLSLRLLLPLDLRSERYRIRAVAVAAAVGNVFCL